VTLPLILAISRSYRVCPSSALPLGLWLLSHDSRHHRRIVQVGRPAFYRRVQPGSRRGGDLELSVDSKRGLHHQTEVFGGVAQLEGGRIVTRLDLDPLGPTTGLRWRFFDGTAQNPAWLGDEPHRL
jgi:hypothetical protein